MLGSRDQVLGRNLTTGSGAKSIESGLLSSFPRLLVDDSDEDDNYVSSATSPHGNAPYQLRLHFQRLRTFFQEVDEGKQAGVESLADLMGGAVRKHDGRIRGVMGDCFDPNELRLLDEQNKKDIRHFSHRRKLEPNFPNWHVFRKQWRFYLVLWDSVMSPHLGTLTLLACLQH